VSFGRRIGAHLLAEGIEKRADLIALKELGVDYGQGYLLGKPSPTPESPRRVDVLRTKSAGAQKAVAATSTGVASRTRTATAGATK
jgi:EAL domain-containing protein (putative c-di-GMP-specific phosphodiesterase class I)